jgi:hypothetical protein
MTVIVRTASKTELSIQIEDRRPTVYDLEAAFTRLTLLDEHGATIHYA